MASSTLSPPMALASPTRVQLDDLEVLIQRMLVLPVVQHDEVLPPVALDTAIAPISAPDFSSLSMSALFPAQWPELVTGAPSGIVEDVALRSSPATLHSTQYQVSTQAEATISAAAGQFASAPESAAVVAQNIGGIGNQKERLHAARWLFLPLVCINRCFDLLTWPLAGVGRWLRGDGGRRLLGWTGVGCLVTAVAWGIIEWSGWTR